MEILLSHNNLDFDGLASLLGAKKLYPDAHIVLVGKVSINIQEFFALHKDVLAYKWAKDIKLDEITSVVLVDIADAKRLGKLRDFVNANPNKVKAVFDHHPREAGDFPAGEGKIDIVGAAATLLVEEIKKRKITLTPFEATVLALGIYEDTGGLIFSSTTARDLYAVAFLVEQGANLSLIANFMDRPISNEQRSLLNILLTSQKIYQIHGYKILIAQAKIDDYIAGLNVVTHQIAEISNADILFSLVMMEDRIHFVARSRVDAADVGKIAGDFGGGGHEKAASAVIRSTDLDKVVETLLKLLPASIKPAITAQTIMTTPVKTLTQDTSITEAGKIMLRYGHSGLPVVEESTLIGIISRRDLEKATHHGLGHAPVKAFMSKDVATITSDTPLSEIQALMKDQDIGRLPVIENDKLVGIVSRTDILKTMHGDNLPAAFKLNYIQACPLNELTNLHGLMLQRLPETLYELIKDIGKLADEYEYSIYLVGGFVRDLLLNLPNDDLDIVVEGDALSFARVLAEKLDARLRAHEKFGTAVVLLPNGEKIDVATARTEFYEFPAALPSVESSTLKQDLYRRDFTVNAMAVNINAARFGDFVDYFNGKADLDKKLVRVLHSLSFVEDPTRLVRAVRFEQRYGFVIEEHTMAFAKHAIENNLVEKLSFHRIREELDLILHEKNPLPALKRLQELNLWEHLMPGIPFKDKTIRALKKLSNLEFEQLGNKKLNKAWLLLMGLFAYINYTEALDVLERYQWPKKERDLVQEFLLLKQKCKEIDQFPDSLKFYHLVFKDYTTEVLLALTVYVNERPAKIIRSYLERRAKVNLEITGNDLAAQGVKPGPLFKEILTKVLAAKISGEITTREEELFYVKKCLEMDNIDV